MANEVQSASEQQSTTGLLAGIISDIGDLIRQEIRFARTEFRADLAKTKAAVTVLAIGAGTAVLGVVLLALMLVFLLHWLLLPIGQSGNYDPATIPLWGCFGIISALLLIMGGALSWLGYKKFQSFNPLPDETAKTVKENVEWIMSSK
jgi:uncharacterized membrane protein YjgN (DUF898 family)